MADFELIPGKLAVAGELYDELRDDFAAQCAGLLESGRREIVLDLSRVSYMASCHLSVILQLHLDAGGRGKRLRVDVTQRIAELFELGRLSDVLHAEVVGKAASGTSGPHGG